MDKRTHELHELGSQLFLEGKYSEAEPILKDVISDNPKYADIRHSLMMDLLEHLFTSKDPLPIRLSQA